MRKRNRSISAGGTPPSRAYADYMATPEFAKGLRGTDRDRASKRPTAIMCAEAVPWRCHRALIADALIKKRVGRPGHHDPDNRSPAPAYAVFEGQEGGQITYPAPSA